ncbi:HEPN domain-containing protein [Candidatus Peregrinibacteria bacterium]|nr:HEPN domain-containing protein [Candidatus Peregrinibacteria bacterium]
MTDKILEIKNYWLKSAEHDYETMLSLHRSKRFSACLFFGHIVLEKILKALVVSETKKSAPFTHDLIALTRLLPKELFNEKDIDLLDDVSRFNIRARYPDVKLKFYKQCTASYTKKYFDAIKQLHQKLCQNLTPVK